MEKLEDMLQSIKVYDCGYEKIRIGDKHDGGYIALKEICQQTDQVLSIGVEDNVSFDLDFVTKFPQAKINLYDHTVDSLPQEHENFTFYQCGVGRKKEGMFDTLENITKDMNSNTLLKMDVEWDEWDIFTDIDIETLRKFNQMLVEFHLIHIDTERNFLLSEDVLTPYFNSFYKDVYEKINDKMFNTYKDVFKKLAEFFYIFHIHANNSLPKVKIDKFLFPPLLELSFIRKDLVANISETKSKYPVEGLDFPNKPYKEDIVDVYPFY